jgi:hypothetical protein
MGVKTSININNYVEIDLGEVDSNDLIEELKRRNEHEAKKEMKFIFDMDKFKAIKKILELREFANKEVVINTIKEL